MKVPMLMDDGWLRMHIHDGLTEAQKTSLTAVVNEFQMNLKSVSDEIEVRNKTREKPFQAFNPKFLECSVSV